MKRILLATLVILAAGVSDVRATEEPVKLLELTISAKDHPADCSSQFGSVTFTGIDENTTAIVEPWSWHRTYTADGTYPIPAGDYNAYAWDADGRYAELSFTVTLCERQRPAPRPRRVHPDAPLPTLPPTDTAS